jgi:hypothetical protein
VCLRWKELLSVVFQFLLLSGLLPRPGHLHKLQQNVIAWKCDGRLLNLGWTFLGTELVNSSSVSAPSPGLTSYPIERFRTADTGINRCTRWNASCWARWVALR